MADLKVVEEYVHKKSVFGNILILLSGSSATHAVEYYEIGCYTLYSYTVQNAFSGSVCISVAGQQEHTDTFCSWLTEYEKQS